MKVNYENPLSLNNTSQTKIVSKMCSDNGEFTNYQSLLGVSPVLGCL